MTKNSIIVEFEKIQATLIQNPSLYVESDKDQKIFRKVCAKTFNIKYCLRLEAYAARLREAEIRKTKYEKKDVKPKMDMMKGAVKNKYVDPKLQKGLSQNSVGTVNA